MQRIIGRRVHPDGEGHQYKVRWRAMQPKDDSWLSLEELANCHDLVREYNTHVDPLPDPPPPPERVPLFSETPLPPPPNANKPSFRPRPVHDHPADTQPADQHATPPPPPATDASQVDPVLQPAIDADSVSFRASGVDAVRPKGNGHQALVRWHNTWAPVSMLEPRRRAEVLQLLHDQGVPAAPPLDSTYPDAQQVYTTVDEIVSVRIGPHMPEAYVRWQPEWLTFSSLTPLLRAEAHSLLAASPPAEQTAIAPPATELSSHTPASTIQRAFRRYLAGRRFWLAPASFNRPGDPRAIRADDTGYHFRFDADSAHAWLAEAALTMAQRRRCKALLVHLHLPAMQVEQMS